MQGLAPQLEGYNNLLFALGFPRDGWLPGPPRLIRSQLCFSLEFVEFFFVGLLVDGCSPVWGSRFCPGQGNLEKTPIHSKTLPVNLISFPGVWKGSA